MKKMFLYLKPFLPKMACGFSLKVIGTLTDLGLPWVLAHIIDEVIPDKNISLILCWGAIMASISLISRTLNILANKMAAGVSRNTIEGLRHDLFEKILNLSGTQLDYYTVPSLEARMTSDTYYIHNMLSTMQRMGVRAPIILIGGIIITGTLEPVLTLVLIVIMPLLMILVYIVSKRGILLYTALQLTVDKVVRVVRENITGIRIIKALSKTESEIDRFFGVNSELVRNELKAGTTMAITNPVMNLLLNSGLTIVVVIGAFRVNAGVSAPGKIVAFLSYFTIMLQSVMSITRIFIICSKASASAARISEVLDAKEDLKVLDAKEDLKVITEQARRDCKEKRESQMNHIEFNHVSFSYTDEPGMTDMNFIIRKGGSLGIIGSTGAGKTTLINLLMRFYDVTEGSIKIEGKNIRAFNKQELRKKFGVVFQNDVLFADKIQENISIGRELPIEQIYESAEHAQAAAFIDELEDKLDFKLSIRGSNLSGGQKQRLLVARALAGRPEILILDDTSSALDFKTDSLLRKAIRENYKGTTTLVIAQRISSVMKLDHILVIVDGQMAGYGTHEELLNSCEVYQEIYQSQLMS